MAKKKKRDDLSVELYVSPQQESDKQDDSLLVSLYVEGRVNATSWAEKLVSEDVGKEIAGLEEELRDVIAPLRKRFQTLLFSLEGKVYDDYPDKARIAHIIHLVATSFRLAFVCPSCRQPARLKCMQAGNSKYGVFSFAHGKGVTHKGTTAVPRLELTEPAPDRRFSTPE